MVEKNKFWGKKICEQIQMLNQCDVNVPYAVIKGEPLSVLAYGTNGMREYADVDILVDKKNLKIMEDILLANGYDIEYNKNFLTSRESRCISLLYSHQLLPYRKIVNRMVYAIDLNHDILWGEYEGKRINIDEFLSDVIEIDIYGIKVKSLPPLKAMVHLVLHHYKDMNSIFLLATRKSIRYDMFKDVYYLLKNNLDTITVDKLYTVSLEYEIIPYVFYVLYYTGQVFDDELLKQYIEACRTPEGEALLNCYGLCDKERKEWKCDFKTRLASENLYNLIMNDLTDEDREKIAINKRVFLRALE